MKRSIIAIATLSVFALGIVAAGCGGGDDVDPTKDVAPVQPGGQTQKGETIDAATTD